jgi:hypothetical protein
MLIVAHSLSPYLMLIVAVHSPIVVHSLSPLPDPQSTRCLHSPIAISTLPMTVAEHPAASIH